MQPAAVPTLTVNNFSPDLLKRRDAWAKEQGIKNDEMLVFRKVGPGTNGSLKIKSTDKKAEYAEFEQVKLTNASFSPPNHESIADAGAPGGYVQLVYFEGGYFPGKVKAVLPFRGGGDDTIITCVPEDMKDRYDFLTLSPRLSGGINNKRGITAQYELVRPEKEVEDSWEKEEAYSDIIQSIKNASIDTLRFLAPKIFLPTEGIIDQRMKKNFSDYAKLGDENVGKLKALFESDENAIYQQVEKAIAADVIAVDRDKAMWVLSQNQEAITPASSDRNTLDQIVAFLEMQPDRVTLKQILALTAEAAKKPAGRPKKELTE